MIFDLEIIVEKELPIFSVFPTIFSEVFTTKASGPVQHSGKVYDL